MRPTSCLRSKTRPTCKGEATLGDAPPGDSRVRVVRRREAAAVRRREAEQGVGDHHLEVPAGGGRGAVGGWVE